MISSIFDAQEVEIFCDVRLAGSINPYLCLVLKIYLFTM